MSGKAFFDTNILIYAIESKGPDPEKFATASALTRQADITISTQVLGEFYRVFYTRRMSALDNFLWVQDLNARIAPKIVDIESKKSPNVVPHHGRNKSCIMSRLAHNPGLTHKLNPVVVDRSLVPQEAE